MQLTGCDWKRRFNSAALKKLSHRLGGWAGLFTAKVVYRERERGGWAEGERERETLPVGSLCLHLCTPRYVNDYTCAQSFLVRGRCNPIRYRLMKPIMVMTEIMWYVHTYTRSCIHDAPFPTLSRSIHVKPCLSSHSLHCISQGPKAPAFTARTGSLHCTCALCALYQRTSWVISTKLWSTNDKLLLLLFMPDRYGLTALRSAASFIFSCLFDCFEIGPYRNGHALHSPPPSYY